MLIPLSWLKEYVDIKMPFPKLAQRMSEVGLTIESWKTDGDDIIFDPEITPNRPDWMSVTGIAREVAAATGTKFSMPDLITVPKVKNPLELNYKDDPILCPRTSRILIKGVRVKSSPEWLLKRIKQIGLRPINNLVDITNFVLWMYGVPLHVFDYDKIRGHTMVTQLSKGGEPFRSLDGVNYVLPKDAIIIKDLGRVIDLLPLKGGENTSIETGTKNVLLHAIVCDPVLTRRTSQALSLRSDCSTVSERGVDPNGTTRAALKALELILDLAGGEVASPLTETPEKPYPTWGVSVSHEKIEKVLGIKVEPNKVEQIFNSLELRTSTNRHSGKQRNVSDSSTFRSASRISRGIGDSGPGQNDINAFYGVTIPTFRNDLHLEEDLIEEVGRMIGYNSFPKTLPTSAVPTQKVAYAHDYDFDYQIKQTLKGAGYSEIYTYSLISEDQLVKLGIDPGKTLRIDNPISKEYEYLRPTMIGNILDAYKQNQAGFSDIRLYEFGKQYQGETCDKATENYWIWGIISGEKFYEAKGAVETILKSFNIIYEIRPATKEDDHYWLHPGRCAQVETKNKEYLGVVGEILPALLSKWAIKNRATVWALNVDLLKKHIKSGGAYQPIPKFPPIIEDVTLSSPNEVTYQEVIDTISKSSKLIVDILPIDSHEGNRTLRIFYQDSSKNLTEQEVSKIHQIILSSLKKIGVTVG